MTETRSMPFQSFPLLLEEGPRNGWCELNAETNRHFRIWFL